MVEAEPIEVPITADSEDFDRGLREAERRSEDFERETQAQAGGDGGGGRDAFIGGGLGGALGALGGQALSQGPLGQVMGSLMTAISVPLIVASMPLLRVIVNNMPAIINLVRQAARTAEGTGQAAEDAGGFLEGPGPGAMRSPAGRAADLALSFGTAIPAQFAGLFALSQGETETARQAFSLPARGAFRGITGRRVQDVQNPGQKLAGALIPGLDRVFEDPRLTGATFEDPDNIFQKSSTDRSRLIPEGFAFK